MDALSGGGGPKGVWGLAPTEVWAQRGPGGLPPALKDLPEQQVYSVPLYTVITTSEVTSPTAVLLVVTLTLPLS